MKRKGMIKKVLLVSTVGCILIFFLFLGVLSSLMGEESNLLYWSEAANEQNQNSQGGGTGSIAGGMDIVAVANQEYADAASNIGGTKYKNWYGMNADWCAMFVSWCADQCGYIEQGIFPRTASVYQMYTFFLEKGRFHYKTEDYRPRPGDVIIYGVSTHTGLVVAYDEETDTVTTIEGNTGNSNTSPFHLGSQVNMRQRPRTHERITGYGNPEYPSWGNIGAGPLQEGEEIYVPAGLGSIHTYMGWQLITSPTSLQYRLRQESGMNFDAEGFGRIGDRYVIACTTTFGGVGDYVDFYKEDGTVLQCIIGDIKNQNDAGCNQWGHLNGRCIIEFVVDRDTWYNPMHTNPGTAFCHPEWNQNIIKAVNRGSYWG